MPTTTTLRTSNIRIQTAAQTRQDLGGRLYEYQQAPKKLRELLTALGIKKSTLFPDLGALAEELKEGSCGTPTSHKPKEWQPLVRVTECATSGW